jgi:hypothetical protein
MYEIQGGLSEARDRGPPLFRTDINKSNEFQRKSAVICFWHAYEALTVHNWCLFYESW